MLQSLISCRYSPCFNWYERESQMGQGLPAAWTGQWLIHWYHCGSLRVWIGAAQHCELEAVVLMSGSWQKGYQWSFIIPAQGNCRYFQVHTHFWTRADICVDFGNSLGQKRRNCHIGDSVQAGKYMTLTYSSSLFFFSSSVFRLKSWWVSPGNLL